MDIVINTDLGLDFVYAQRDTFETFEEFEIRSYPALRLSPGTSPTCEVWVGLAERQVLVVHANSLKAEAPRLCEAAVNVSASVLVTLGEA